MIYEGRIVKVKRGMEEEWINRAFNGFFPAIRRCGGRPIGAYQTVIGNSEDYYIVVEFDSLTHRDKVFEAMAKDVEYQKLEKSWKGIITLTNIYSTMIKPIEPPKK
jgi:hypothetical protein